MLSLLQVLLLWVSVAAVYAQDTNEASNLLNLYPDREHAPFLNGVASGDPLQDRVLIWTRVVTEATTVAIRWSLWEQQNSAQSFDSPLKSDAVVVSAATDFTTTIDVTGLQPGTSYHYQFQVVEGNHRSMLGTTRTLPRTSRDFSVALLSCTSLYSGYFNFYRHLAQNPDVDVVLHVGDYIYPEIDPDEQIRIPSGLCPDNSWYRNSDVGGDPLANSDPYLAELVARQGESCEKDYRFVYELYHLDPDFRAARANHPFIVQFDNHDLESSSNIATLPSRRASYDWVPQRRIIEDGIVTTIRNFTVGDLVDMIILDTYSYEQDKPENGLLGEGQHAWLEGLLEASATTWRLFATAKTFMPTVTNIAAPGATELVYLNASPNTWEGQQASVMRLMDQLERTQTDSNNLWVSGDMHFCLAADVFRYDPDTLDLLAYDPLEQTTVRRYGGEILGCSGTRGNLDETLASPNPDPRLAGLDIDTLQNLFRLGNRHYSYFNGQDHGYGVAHFQNRLLTATFFQFPILSHTDDFTVEQRFMRRDGNRWLEENRCERRR